MLTNLANLLTLSRIAAIPLVIGAFYIDEPLGNWLGFAIYTLACLTDFFDGYIARAWSQQSALGRFLDPVADKLLVAALLLMLVATGRIPGVAVLPAVVILCREILVSGLREFLAEVRVSVPVSALAKWKTAIQMVALGFLMAGAGGNAVMPAALPATMVGEYALWVAATLTLYTGYDYFRAGMRHLSSNSTPTPPRGPHSVRPAE